MDKKTEALKMAQDWYDSGNENHDDFAKMIKQVIALVEQSAQQSAERGEPIDKNGSPCPEFWDWLPKAYNFEGLGNFTKYNMEVAFLAGKQSVPAQQLVDWEAVAADHAMTIALMKAERKPWVGLDASDYCGQSEEWCDGALAAEAKLKEKNA